MAGKKRSMMGIKMGYGQVVAVSPSHRAGRIFVRIERSDQGQFLSQVTERCGFRAGCEEDTQRFFASSKTQLLVKQRFPKDIMTSTPMCPGQIWNNPR